MPPNKRFAAGTEVLPQESLQELRRTIVKYEGDNFAYGEGITRVWVEFDYRKRRLRFTLPLPDLVEENRSKFYQNVIDERKRLREAEVRRRWRALVLTVKALLEAVDSGILTAEAALLGEMVMPDSSGMTVAEAFGPQIQAAYDRAPLALPAPGTKR